jgi:hypothetical protein
VNPHVIGEGPEARAALLDDREYRSDQNEDRAADTKAAARTMRTFLVMCVSFSLNMGVVTTVIAFAGADFPDIGVYSIGICMSIV